MRYILSLIGLLLSAYATAQTIDLIKLAQGKYLGMQVLFDNEQHLFGYIALYDYGKVNDTARKFEYFILDKNLNPVANKEFEGDVTAADYVAYINFDNKVVLKPTELDVEIIDQSKAYSPASMEIDLEQNTISKHIFYEYKDGKIIEVIRPDTWKSQTRARNAERREKGFVRKTDVTEIKEGGFLVDEYEDYSGKSNNNRLIRFDAQKNKLWEYAYKQVQSKYEYAYTDFFEIDEHYLYGIAREKKLKQDIKFALVVMDMNTGQMVHQEAIMGDEYGLSEITNISAYGYRQLTNKKVSDDKIILVGRRMRKGKDLKGLSRLIISKNTFAVQYKSVSYENNLKNYLLKYNGTALPNNGFHFDPRDIFFLQDGSIGVLFEEYAPPGKSSPPHTGDMFYIHMNKNFDLDTIRHFKKRWSVGQYSDYLFSQYIDNDKNLVFFYRDYQKSKETRLRNWNLFINTIIDGNFKQEIIPLSSKEGYIIFPYIAKEGYILLQEYNVKEKYNQLRMERLNY